MHNDPKKGVIVSACKVKVAARTNSAWGAAVVKEKALANTAQAGGWGNIGACRNKATSNTGLGRSTFNSRNSRDKHSVAHNFDGGCKKFNEPWDKGKNVNGIQTRSWSNPYVKNQVDSYGKGKDDVRGESTWGKAESFGMGRQEKTFGKAATSFGNKPKALGADVNPSLNKQDVGSFLNKQGNGSWKKQGGFSCSSWERPKTFEGGPSSGGRSGRGGGQGGRDQCGRGRGGGRGGRGQFSRGRGEGRGGIDQFGKARGSGRGSANQFGRGRPCDQGQSFAQGFGGWKKSRTDDNADQHGNLEKPKTFEGGRGLGGRTGRGANRGGSTQNYGTNAGMSMANHPSSWGKFQGFDGSKKAVVFTGDEMRSTRPGGNTPSWSGDQAAGGWGKPRITMQVGRMMLKQVARAAQVMGDQNDSWGNKKEDGYGWSKQ